MYNSREAGAKVELSTKLLNNGWLNSLARHRQIMVLSCRTNHINTQISKPDE
jgi:hypothetical protein